MTLFELCGFIGAAIGLSLGIYYGSSFGFGGVIIGIIIGFSAGFAGGLLMVLPILLMGMGLAYAGRPFNRLWRQNQKRYRIQSIITQK